MTENDQIAHRVEEDARAHADLQRAKRIVIDAIGIFDGDLAAAVYAHLTNSDRRRRVDAAINDLREMAKEQKAQREPFVATPNDVGALGFLKAPIAEIFADDEVRIVRVSKDEYMASARERGLPLECVQFQAGPVAQHGVNGLQHEHLLVILEDRLKAFQAGPYACKENEACLIHIQAALKADRARTAARTAAGTEGAEKV